MSASIFHGHGEFLIPAQLGFYVLHYLPVQKRAQHWPVIAWEYSPDAATRDSNACCCVPVTPFGVWRYDTWYLFMPSGIVVCNANPDITWTYEHWLLYAKEYARA